MWTLPFWKAVLERAIKTFAQVLASLLIGDEVGIFDIDWFHVLAVAVLAAAISVLTSVASCAVTGGQASLTGVETITNGAEKHGYPPTTPKSEGVL